LRRVSQFIIALAMQLSLDRHARAPRNIVGIEAKPQQNDGPPPRALAFLLGANARTPVQ